MTLGILLGLLAVAELPWPALAQQSEADTQPYVAIDFNDVDIGVFIKFISELTGTNFVVDPRVKGKVTINSPTQITVDEAYKVFESVLELNGFTTIPSGEITKIVPSAVARSKSLETIVDPEEQPEVNDRMATRLIQLTYANAEEMRRLLAPLIAKTSVILAYPQTNSLIITDTISNIQRLEQILTAVDKPGVGQEVAVIPLGHADATKMAQLLETVFKSQPIKGQKSAQESIRFMADERTNTLVLLASEMEIVRARELIEMLDKQTPRGSEKIRVYYLEHATAEDLAAVLQEVPAKGEGQENTEGGKRAVISGKVKIMPDKATNSLVIMAEKDDFGVLEEIIAQLDIPRAMVYIECLIMEVDVEKDFTIGTQWVGGGDVDINGRPGIIGGGFGGGNDFGNIGGLISPQEGAAGALPPGFSLGVFSDLVEIGGIKFPSLAAIVNAYKNDRDVHILSTPQLLTTDNQEATIMVGKNIPYQTKSGASEVESFNTFEYRDVGITLKITPQISKDRMVRLKIYQEVTKVEDLSQGQSQVAERPTTLKRTIDTTVVALDSNTVVIGGLIDESFSAATNQIPCLGAIPLFGWLFKSHGDSREKTNLYVFLTPKVVQSPAEATTLYELKQEQIDEVRSGVLKLYEPLPGGPEPWFEEEKDVYDEAFPDIGTPSGGEF
jgi:general secretion pathway protein D